MYKLQFKVQINLNLNYFILIGTNKIIFTIICILNTIDIVNLLLRIVRSQFSEL